MNDVDAVEWVLTLSQAIFQVLLCIIAFESQTLSGESRYCPCAQTGS